MTYFLHSIAGMGALLAALMMLVLSIYESRSREASRRAQWWASLIIAAGYALLGAGFYCRSYAADHEPLAVSSLIWSGIGVLVVGFVLSRRKWKAEKPKPTHSGS